MNFNNLETQGIKFLLNVNQQVAANYNSEAERANREAYRQQHPTAICALTCMDGRVDVALQAQIPPGIIQTWKNLGGKFELGWPLFLNYYRKWQNMANREGRDVPVLATHHFSKSNKELGCRGWGYDQQKALEFTARETHDFARQPGERNVYPIQVGIETDESSLTFYGENGENLNLANECDTSLEHLALRLNQIYPRLPERIIGDLLPIIQGNIKHVCETRAVSRSWQEVDHKESTLAIGLGFDWLQLYNHALIVGPFERYFSPPILTAASILLDNISSGRVDPKKQDIVLLLNHPFWRDQAASQRDAAIIVESLVQETTNLIRDNYPELAKLMHVLAGTTNMETLEFKPLTGTFFS